MKKDEVWDHIKEIIYSDGYIDLREIVGTAYIQGYLEGMDESHISRVSIADLKLMWDEWAESASEDMETNKFHYEEIHAELNRRGEGDYCAV